MKDAILKHAYFVGKSELRTPPTTNYSQRPCVNPALLFASDIFTGNKLSPYLPAMLDIYDGIEMSETKLLQTNSKWMQAMICLAIIMLHISSLLEIYHLKFPELINGKGWSEQKVRLAQLVCSVVFLLHRLLLARNIREIFFLANCVIRVCCNYKMWLKVRGTSRCVPVMATEISAEKASCFANERQRHQELKQYLSDKYLKNKRRQNTPG